MFKRLGIGLAILIGLAAPVHGAGTVPGISMTQQLDSLGRPLNGGKLYLIQAGTTSTPQNCYQDSGLTLAWPNPITLDSAGRVPQLFCADGAIKIRLTNSAGVQQLVADNLLVVGRSGGGGGDSPVDATTVLATGDLKARYGTGALTGFVRANGRTIGSETSGASERANADTQALFEYLWGADSNLSVSGGRGASANADWVANKTITLPDWRGRALAFLDDMGNSAAGRLTATYFGAAATVLGAAGGAESQTLSLSQLPTGIASQATNLVVSGSNNAGLSFATAASQTTSFSTGTGGATGWIAWGTGATVLVQPARADGSGIVSTNTGGTAHPIASPMMLATIYMKL